ncbi:MAG: VWA domain-containing protein [Polyangiales bacterium]
MNQPFARLARRHASALAVGCVALAAGGIVLLRAPHGGVAAPHEGPAVTVTTPPSQGSGPTRAVFGDAFVRGRVALSQGAVARRGDHALYAEVRVAARDFDGEQPRRPVALALVLDVSGSMSGEKIIQARNAVLDTVARMRDDDRIALVTYSDGAQVVQPLARVGDVRARLQTTVPTIQTIAGTNIPEGLRAGADALSEAPDSLARRVVLISDGRDGSGQSLDLISQGVRLRADNGATLSSLGVGADYDEAFMTRLADAGRGNYEFLRNGAQLRAFLSRELEQTQRTRVDRAVAELDLPAGVTLDRAFGAEAEVHGSTVRLPVGALAAGEERRMVVALRVEPAVAADGVSLHSHVAYRALSTREARELTPGALALRVVDSDAQASASRDLEVWAEAESTAAAARQHDAVAAWQQGRVEEAQRLATTNVANLQRIEREAPAAAPMASAQLRQINRDSVAFGSLSAGSEAGRAYGLGANALHRRATRSSMSY